MINLLRPLMRPYPLAYSAFLCVIACTSAQSGELPTSLLESIPAQWKPIVARACVARTPEQAASVEVYFSDYLDDRKLLLFGADGSYHLMYWDESNTGGRLYGGTYQRNNERISLDLAMNAQSLGSDANDAELVPMRIGAQRFLLQEESLNDIGTAIQWHQSLGEGRDYFVKARCDQFPPAFAADGPEVPRRSELPDALKRFVFAKPVDAHIVDLADDSRSYDYTQRDGEFLVRVDKGSNEGFRLNMPLCSPRRTPQRWKGWVGDTRAETSDVRIVIHERKPGQALVFPAVGQVLTTSAGECDGLESE